MKCSFTILLVLVLVSYTYCLQLKGGENTKKDIPSKNSTKKLTQKDNAFKQTTQAMNVTIRQSKSERKIANVKLASTTPMTSSNPLHNNNDREIEDIGDIVAKMSKMPLFQKLFSKPQKRPSKRYYIPMLVVADRSFINFHKHTDSDDYIKNAINMVSEYFHDSSLGVNVSVTVSRTVYLDKESDVFRSDTAFGVLQNFCGWTNKRFYNNDYDIHRVAVLVTREELVGKGNRSVQGATYAASACLPQKACILVRDRGLLLGVNIAHQLGHLLGAAHDGDNGIPSNLIHSFVMLPSVKHDRVLWSESSRMAIGKLFSDGLGKCLEKQPSSMKRYPNMLPGAAYNADMQCQLLHKGSRSCYLNTEDFCKQLFCEQQNGSCISSGIQPAQGTSCGIDRWCFNTECVHLGYRPGAINGGWDEWLEWGPCSRSCGGGVKMSQRLCSRPTPAHGGRHCVGSPYRANTCNTQACPIIHPSYRAVQCVNVFGKGVKVEHRSRAIGCILRCSKSDKGRVVRLQAQAADGTPCRPGTNDMCVKGACMRVGCDWVLGSSVTEDRCGVCRGDGNGCELVNVHYNISGHQDSNNTVFVGTLPRWSTRVKIYETEPSTNHLALAVSHNRQNAKQYLVGGSKQTSYGEFKVGGLTGYYTHLLDNQDYVMIKGPLPFAVNLYQVGVSKNLVPVNYSYMALKKSPHISSHVRSNRKSKSCNYEWEYLEWSTCSARCNGGFQRSRGRCVSPRAGVVTDTYCEETRRPRDQIRVCNLNSCASRWKVGPWCGNGDTRLRTVVCMREVKQWQSSPELAEDSLCVDPKPPTVTYRSSNKKNQSNNLKKNLLVTTPESILVNISKITNEKEANHAQRAEVRTTSKNHSPKETKSTTNALTKLTPVFMKKSKTTKEKETNHTQRAEVHKTSKSHSYKETNSTTNTPTKPTPMSLFLKTRKTTKGKETYHAQHAEVYKPIKNHSRKETKSTKNNQTKPTHHKKNDFKLTHRKGSKTTHGPRYSTQKVVYKKPSIQILTGKNDVIGLKEIAVRELKTQLKPTYETVTKSSSLNKSVKRINSSEQVKHDTQFEKPLEAKHKFDSLLKKRNMLLNYEKYFTILEIYDKIRKELSNSEISTPFVNYKNTKQTSNINNWQRINEYTETRTATHETIYVTESYNFINNTEKNVATIQGYGDNTTEFSNFKIDVLDTPYRNETIIDKDLIIKHFPINKISNNLDFTQIQNTSNDGVIQDSINYDLYINDSPNTNKNIIGTEKSTIKEDTADINVTHKLKIVNGTTELLQPNIQMSEETLKKSKNLIFKTLIDYILDNNINFTDIQNNNSSITEPIAYDNEIFSNKNDSIDNYSTYLANSDFERTGLYDTDDYNSPIENNDYNTVFENAIKSSLSSKPLNIAAWSGTPVTVTKFSDNENNKYENTNVVTIYPEKYFHNAMWKKSNKGRLFKFTDWFKFRNCSVDPLGNALDNNMFTLTDIPTKKKQKYHKHFYHGTRKPKNKLTVNGLNSKFTDSDTKMGIANDYKDIEDIMSKTLFFSNVTEDESTITTTVRSVRNYTATQNYIDNKGKIKFNKKNIDKNLLDIKGKFDALKIAIEKEKMHNMSYTKLKSYKRKRRSCKVNREVDEVPFMKRIREDQSERDVIDVIENINIYNKNKDRNEKQLSYELYLLQKDNIYIVLVKPVELNVSDQLYIIVKTVLNHSDYKTILGLPETTIIFNKTLYKVINNSLNRFDADAMLTKILKDIVRAKLNNNKNNKVSHNENTSKFQHLISVIKARNTRKWEDVKKILNLGPSKKREGYMYTYYDFYKLKQLQNVFYLEQKGNKKKFNAYIILQLLNDNNIKPLIGPRERIVYDRNVFEIKNVKQIVNIDNVINTLIKLSMIDNESEIDRQIRHKNLYYDPKIQDPDVISNFNSFLRKGYRNLTQVNQKNKRRIKRHYRYQNGKGFKHRARKYVTLPKTMTPNITTSSSTTNTTNAVTSTGKIETKHDVNLTIHITLNPEKYNSIDVNNIIIETKDSDVTDATRTLKLVPHSIHDKYSPSTKKTDNTLSNTKRETTAVDLNGNDRYCYVEDYVPVQDESIVAADVFPNEALNDLSENAYRAVGGDLPLTYKMVRAKLD